MTAAVGTAIGGIQMGGRVGESGPLGEAEGALEEEKARSKRKVLRVVATSDVASGGS